MNKVTFLMIFFSLIAFVSTASSITLEEYVNELANGGKISVGKANALLNKANQIAIKEDMEKYRAAAGKKKAFDNQVNALVKSRKISETEAEDIKSIQEGTYQEVPEEGGEAPEEEPGGGESGGEEPGGDEEEEGSGGENGGEAPDEE